MMARTLHKGMQRGSLLLGLSALLACPGVVGSAQAIPLCENVTDSTCREDVDAKVDTAVAALVAGIPSESVRRSAVVELEKASSQFDLARLEISDADPSLTEERICSRAGKQDDRGLRQITKGVKAAEKIKADKFSSEAAFTAARTALTELAQAVIDAVGDNAAEVDALVGPLPELDDAADRLDAAQTALEAGKLSKAAEGGQRGYDVIRDHGNVATCLANQQ